VFATHRPNASLQGSVPSSSRLVECACRTTARHLVFESLSGGLMRTIRNPDLNMALSVGLERLVRGDNERGGMMALPPRDTDIDVGRAASAATSSVAAASGSHVSAAFPSMS